MAAADRPTPTEIKLRQKSRVLEISFSDGSRFELPYEFLRVCPLFREPASMFA
jgi:DUF971 family protein